jgi:hypothetical protein
VLTIGDPADWVTRTFVVIDETVNITNTPVDSTPGGMPEFARGFWAFEESGPAGSDDYSSWPALSVEGSLLVTQWNANMDVRATIAGEGTFFHSMTVAIIEVEGTGNTRDIIVNYPIYKGTLAHTRAAVEDFFSTRDGITYRNSWGEVTSSGRQFVIEESPCKNFWDICWINFNDMTLVNQFYNTNHEERYKISQGVTPNPAFEKNRLVFGPGNSTVDWMMFGNLVDNGFDYFYFNPIRNTFAEAKALTTLDTDYITLSRP